MVVSVSSLALVLCKKKRKDDFAVVVFQVVSLSLRGLCAFNYSIDGNRETVEMDVWPPQYTLAIPKVHFSRDGCCTSK